MLVHDFDHAPVGEITNYQMSNGRQRLLVIERGGQHGSRFGQKLLLFLDALALGDVAHERLPATVRQDVRTHFDRARTFRPSASESTRLCSRVPAREDRP